jgi:NADH-quinone oxidoreductase subunit J
MMTPDLIFFLLLGLVAVVAALGMLFSRNTVYSALFLIVNFATVAVFYLVLNAPFIALSQITVYAGAIMVLFLFVIMLLGVEQAAPPAAGWSRPLALILGAVLFIETGYLILTQRDTLPALQTLPEGFGSPAAVGEMLFNQYLLPFEATSILLLSAMVGAIVLSLDERRKRREAIRRSQQVDGAPVEMAQSQVKPVDLVPTEMGERELQ